MAHNKRGTKDRASTKPTIPEQEATAQYWPTVICPLDAVYKQERKIITAYFAVDKTVLQILTFSLGSHPTELSPRATSKCDLE